MDRVEALKDVELARQLLEQIRNIVECKFFEYPRNISFEFEAHAAIARFVRDGLYTFWDLSITKHNFEKLGLLLVVAEARMEFCSALHWVEKVLDSTAIDSDERHGHIHHTSMALYDLDKKEVMRLKSLSSDILEVIELSNLIENLRTKVIIKRIELLRDEFREPYEPDESSGYNRKDSFYFNEMREAIFESQKPTSYFGITYKEMEMWSKFPKSELEQNMKKLAKSFGRSFKWFMVKKRLKSLFGV